MNRATCKGLLLIQRLEQTMSDTVTVAKSKNFELPSLNDIFNACNYIGDMFAMRREMFAATATRKLAELEARNKEVEVEAREAKNETEKLRQRLEEMEKQLQ